MSSFYHKLWSLLVCSPNSPGRQPLDTLVYQLAHSSSFAHQAAHLGIAQHTAAMTAAAASSSAAVCEAAAAGGAAVAAAAAAGSAAAADAVRQGRAWGVRTALTAMLVATGAWLSVVQATCDTATLLVTSLPKTMRAAAWAVKAGLSYKRFAALRVGQDPEGEEYQEALGELHTYWATELLRVCRANGGVYVKAGQFAASFGAVPREFRVTLAGLEDRAVPRPYPAIQAAVKRELGVMGGMQLFSQFDEKATAAASLAQVHRAILRSSGEAVAVKIQYPGLESAVKSDLAVLRVFNFWAALLFPDYRLAWLVDELDKKLVQELDFRTELYNSSRVSKLLHNNKCVAVPTMHKHLCTKHLLVMEWVDGVKVNDKEAVKAKGVNPRAVGRQLVKLFGELTLIHGFMHGDPHAGRRSIWWWLTQGSRQPYEIVLLDHGTYLELSEEMRQQFCQLWCSFVLQDRELQAELSSNVAGERGAVVLPVLLTQTARSRAEERAVRKAAGITGVGDMAALLQSAPRPVIEVLRINTVIRAISNQLGVTMDERKRIIASYARRGLPPWGSTAHHVHQRFNGIMCRAYLWAMLGAWDGASAAKSVALRGWSLVLGFWEDVLLD